MNKNSDEGKDLSSGDVLIEQFALIQERILSSNVDMKWILVKEHCFPLVSTILILIKIQLFTGHL